MEHHGITVDPNRDTLFDELGTMRLRESYMLEEEISPQERLVIVLLSYPMVVASVGFLLAVISISSMIQRKVWSKISRKQTGYLCWEEE